MRPSQHPFGVLTDAALVAYAFWTVGANAVVLAGGGARSLAVVFGLVALATFGVIWLVATRQSLRNAYLADLAPDPVAPRAVLTRGNAVGMLCLPAFTLVAWLVTRNAWIAWAGSALCALYAVSQALREPAVSIADDAVPSAPATLSRAEHIGLHALALACAVFSLLVVRPRADDTFYLSMAVSVVDYPQQALLSLKTLHGPASDTLSVQRMFAPYRVHSFELLGGVLSYLTGIDAVRVIHLGLATVLCWLTPFAVARLLRLLIPRAWLLGVVVVIAFYMIEGTAARGYANHALVRMFNGKSAMLTLLLPLICVAGLRCGARVSGIRLALLALSQIAAVGLSSTGLWLAPSVAMVSVAAGTPRMRQLPSRFFAGLFSSGYVIALGLWVLAQLGAGTSEPAEVEALTESSNAAFGANIPQQFVEIAAAIPVALGPERSACALLVVALLAGLVAPTVLGLRLFSLLAALVACVFANPFFAKLLAHYVTGVTTYPRVFWLLPVATGLGVCCGALFSWLRRRFAPAASVALSLSAVAAFLLLATDRLVVSEANQARLAFPPALKLWPHSRTEAEEICRWATAGQYVLASQAVSLQLPIVHGCGYPIATFDRWLSAPDLETQERNELVRLVDVRQDLSPERAAWFVDALARHHVDVVVLSRQAAPNTRVKSLIRIADYERVATVEWNQIFVRTRRAERAELKRVAREVCRIVTRGEGLVAPFSLAAAVDRLGCATVITAPSTVLKAPAAEFDDLAALERVAYMESEPSSKERARIAASIESRGVAAVVLSKQARGNRWFKALLGALGFRKAGAVGEYGVLVRSSSPPE